jgi:hypothetical protein
MVEGAAHATKISSGGDFFDGSSLARLPADFYH